MIVYSIQPLIFLHTLSQSTLTVMNLLWNVSSDVMVTLTGLYYFNEKINEVNKLGILLSFIAMFLLAWK